VPADEIYSFDSISFNSMMSMSVRLNLDLCVYVRSAMKLRFTLSLVLYDIVNVEGMPSFERDMCGGSACRTGGAGHNLSQNRM